MFKKISILFFTLTISIGMFAFSATNSALQKVTKKYRDSQLVEMKVEKIVKSELLGKETKHSGKIYLANGKFRWENTSPEKTLLVFDGSTIWSEQTPPKEFGGPVQVAKGKIGKKNRSNILISSLMGADLEKNFKIGKQEKMGSFIKFDVVPNNNDLTVKSLQVLIDPSNQTMKSISYTDDIGNQTTMSFSDIKFLNKSKNSLFKYQPPKGAQVSDL
ncbi:MAG: LolA family protein [Bdellovibrio sp.]